MVATCAGSVDDFTAQRRLSIRSSLAAEAGVDVSAVHLRVLSASVLVEATIDAASPAAGAALFADLAARLADVVQATALLGVQVEAPPVVSIEEKVTIIPAPSPPPPEPSPPSAPGTDTDADAMPPLWMLACGAGLLLACLAASACLVLKFRRMLASSNATWNETSRSKTERRHPSVAPGRAAAPNVAMTRTHQIMSTGLPYGEPPPPTPLPPPLPPPMLRKASSLLDSLRSDGSSTRFHALDEEPAHASPRDGEVKADGPAGVWAHAPAARRAVPPADAPAHGSLECTSL